jgi:hypothetical protein
MDINKIKIDLKKYRPCKGGLNYYEGQKTSIEAWENCKRGDWMLWAAAKLGVDERKLFLAKGKCAETVIHLMKDNRSKKAVKAAIEYGLGLTTKEDLAAAAAAAAAYAAAYAAYVSNDYAYSAIKSHQKETAYICMKVLTKEIKNILTS